MPEFVEFAGQKTYQCPKCKAEIRYAKFFGPDKKLLTTDGKEPFGKEIDGKYKSNTGWPTNPNTKQMHECSQKSESLKREITDVEELSEIDKKVRDRIILDAYDRAKFLIWKLEGVEKACKELGVERGPQSGMIFNQVCAEDRSLNEDA